MKLVIQILIAGLVLLLGFAGCEYDGPTSAYDQPYNNSNPPMIASIDPPVAVAGVNYIHIHGENFSMALDSNKVYIDGIPTEIVEYSETLLKIRRPNTIGDSTTIKVVNYEAFFHTSYTPYQIDPVYETYGGFIENLQLVAVDVDAFENVYIAQRTPRNIYKIDPSGVRTEIGLAARNVTDMKLASDGKLVLFSANKKIEKLDVNTGIVEDWISQDERVAYGDFDAAGNLYTGGKRTGVVVIRPDLSVETPAFYSQDEIFCVRVFNNAVYFLAAAAKPDEDTPAMAVWKHEILDEKGTLGVGEVAVDWAAFGFGEAVPTCLTFSDDGILYIVSNHSQPIVTYDIAGGITDIYYKNILPAGAAVFSWGTANFLYVIQSGDENNLLRIDMGRTGAPYYGR